MGYTCNIHSPLIGDNIINRYTGEYRHMLTSTLTEGISLEDFMANPPEHMKCVDGQL